MKFDVVIAIAPFEKEAGTIRSVKKAGATGAAVISAHGAGIKMVLFLHF